jgi:aspartyl-tRNA(Asn)/glutamyl-tRNA(Gln) amidotransferase subunit B
MVGAVAALANEHRVSLARSGLGVDGLARLLRLLIDGVINGPTAKELLAELYVSGGDADALVRSRGLAQLSDTAELTALVDDAIRENAAAAADFQAGKDAALGRLVGAVMKATRGKAQPQLVDRLLRERLPRS